MDRRQRSTEDALSSEKTLRIELDGEACTGHGRCYEIAPDVFTDDDHGHCVLTLAVVPPGLADDARRAVANCPERALRICTD
jgi:ferredoxin